MEVQGMPSESNNKAHTYEELTPGYEFLPVSYELSAALISKYLEAVDGKDSEFVPPLAIAAYAITATSSSLTLPPGAIHASQELEFLKLVPIGAKVNCQARVARKLSRGQMHMLVLELTVRDENNEVVQSGRVTVILPA